MAIETDVTTYIGQVRALCRDNVDATAIFTDAEIAFFLANQGNDVHYAAAEALDAIASNKAQSALMAKTINFTKDTRFMADVLAKAANALRDNAMPAYGAGQPAYNSFVAAEIIIGNLLRGD